MTEPSAKRHLIYIPTHRGCAAVIDERLQEAMWARRRTAEVFFFCVIDNSTGDLQVRDNHSFFDARRPSLLEAAFVDQRTADAIVDQLLEPLVQLDRSLIRRLLLPEGLSYGRGPNLASIIGAALGVGSVHRRDSDEYQDLERPGLYPIEFELVGIDQHVREISPLPRHAEAAVAMPVRMVGTSMFGYPPIDRRALFEAGTTFETAFQQLGRPGVPIDLVRDEAHEYLEVEPTIRYDDDFLDATAPERVEMGSSCASAALFSLLPEMPGNIIGTDYMQRDLAWRLDWPILFHSRKAHHVYDERRRMFLDRREYMDYAVRDVQYLQVGRIWNKHGDQLKTEQYFLTDALGAFDREHYALSFLDAAASSRDVLREVREGAAAIYAAASEQASDSGLAERLTDISSELLTRGSGIDAHVIDEVCDYVALVRAWPTLIAEARGLHDNVASLFTSGV